MATGKISFPTRKCDDCFYGWWIYANSTWCHYGVGDVCKNYGKKVKMLLALLLILFALAQPAEARLPRIVRRVLAPIGIPLVLAKNVIVKVKEGIDWWPVEIVDYWYTDKDGGGIYH